MKTKYLLFGLIFCMLPILSFSILNNGSAIKTPAIPTPQIISAFPVNPAHEMFPPIAEKVELKPITGSKLGNLLLKAWIKKGTLTTNSKAPMFTVPVGKQKVTLRDDGKAGDEKAFDGVFSVMLKEDLQNVSNNMKLLEHKLLKSKKTTVFEGRNVKTMASKAALQKFTFDSQKISTSLLQPNATTSKQILTFNPVIVQPSGPVPQVVKDNSLFVTDLGVVEDPTRTFNPCTGAGNPTGVWTFTELMRQLASPNPSTIATDAQTVQFIKDFLFEWGPVTVNGDFIDPRSIASILNDWQTLSGSPTEILEHFPAKLTAIVNRSDLAGNHAYGVTSGGEGRFVFCLLDANCNARPMNFIFEYGIPIKTCTGFKSYVQQWWNLQFISIGSPLYNQALENITNSFTRTGSNPSKPNQSALNQLRTNEIALGSPWELREFILQPTPLISPFVGVPLVSTTTKLEPQRKFNDKAVPPTVDEDDLAAFVNANTTDIILERHNVPLTFNGQDFLSGHALTFGFPLGTPTPPSNSGGFMDNTPHHWDASLPGTSGEIFHDDARHFFSINTCSGCHGGDTRCQANNPSGSSQPFVHVGFVPFGQQAGLSSFLTGLGADDQVGDNDADPNGQFFLTDAASRPVGNPTIRGFNDLERRGIELQSDVNKTCGFVIGPPILPPPVILNPPVIGPIQLGTITSPIPIQQGTSISTTTSPTSTTTSPTSTTIQPSGSATSTSVVMDLLDILSEDALRASH